MATSIATKRKIVIDEFHDFDYPNLALGHEIAKIHKSPGNYLFEVITAKNVAEDLIENFNQKVVVSDEHHGCGDAIGTGTAISSSTDTKVKEKKYHLASMPTKFRKTVYLIRGTFVYVEPIDGNKVKYEIVRILNKDHIKRLYLEDLWPEEFSEAIDLKTSRQVSATNKVAISQNSLTSQSQSEEQKLEVKLDDSHLQGIRSDDDPDADDEEEEDDDQLENDYHDDLMGGNPNNKRKHHYQEEDEESSDAEYEESYEEEGELSDGGVDNDGEDDDTQLGIRRKAKGYSSEESSHERRARANASSDNDRC